MSVDIEPQRSNTTTMDDDHEDFEDAFEVLPASSSPQDLESALEDARKAIHYFFNNQFDEARNTLKAYADSSLYHSLGTSVFCFLEALLTFQQDHIKLASDSLKNCVNVCDRLRRKNTMYETLGKMVKRPNYNTYTSMEIHAELCYAEALLLKSLLTFVEDETLVTFIKAGLKIRSCYNSYKECAEILNSRDWSNDPNKVHFESGVRMGIGAFNLMISLLPARVIKLLEFIGFGGSKELGLSELQQGFQLKNSLRQVLCVMLLLAYHLIIVYVLSHRDGDLALCDEILQEKLAMYPQGVWFLFFKARLEFMRGNLDEASTWYVRSWRSQDLWPHFHHLCFWELMFVHCMRLDWRTAHEYASKLTEQSRWSRTIYSYQRAVILHMMQDELTPEEQLKVEELMRDAPKWKQRIAGKSLPMEKFAIKKSERYFAQKKYLVLPALELLYMWNLFKVIGKHWDLAERVFLLIDSTMKKLERGNQYSDFDADNKALVLLLKGALLQVMGSPLQAEQCLQQVLSLEKQIRDDTYVIPYAMVELAVIAQSQNQPQQAAQLVESVRKNYTGYSTENRLHFRMHAIMLDIAEQKKSSDVEEAVETGEEIASYQTRL